MVPTAWFQTAMADRSLPKLVDWTSATITLRHCMTDYG